MNTKTNPAIGTSSEWLEAHFQQAAKLAMLPAERDFLARRIDECGKATE